MFGVGATLAAAAALLPAQAVRKRAARAIARLGLRVGGLPIHVEGSATLEGGSWIIVSNHASYLDWLLLTAVLPARACFVAKRELAQSAPLKWMLDRMGVRFVERDDVHAGVEDAKRLVQAAIGRREQQSSIDKFSLCSGRHSGLRAIKKRACRSPIPVVHRRPASSVHWQPCSRS